MVREIPPTCWPASITIGLIAELRCNSMAAVSPAGPAPMMIAVPSFTRGIDPFLLNNQSITMISHKKQTRGGIFPSPRLCLLDSAGIRPVGSQRLHVRSLPPLGPLHHVELHGLTFLQALETTGGDCRVMHEYVFAVLTRNKAEALRVVEPLHGTLFHIARIS